MRKDELTARNRESQITIEFAKHTFTGKLLYKWYSIERPAIKHVHSHNILHITDINLYFVLYSFYDGFSGKGQRCAIAATYNLELARNILSLAATQSQLALLGRVPELEGIQQGLAQQAYEAWGDLIDHDKKPLSDDDLSDCEIAAMAVVKEVLDRLNL